MAQKQISRFPLNEKFSGLSGHVPNYEYVKQQKQAEVPGSNPASPTMILGRCRIIVSYYKTQGRGVHLHLRPKRERKKKVQVLHNLWVSYM